MLKYLLDIHDIVMSTTTFTPPRHPLQMNDEHKNCYKRKNDTS